MGRASGHTVQARRMISDRDIWAAARLLVMRYREDAGMEATKRADGSCLGKWCKSSGGVALSGWAWPDYHAAGTADSMTMGSSLSGAMVSRLM